MLAFIRFTQYIYIYLYTYILYHILICLLRILNHESFVVRGHTEESS
jgi:hypothetical protein